MKSLILCFFIFGMPFIMLGQEKVIGKVVIEEETNRNQHEQTTDGGSIQIMTSTYLLVNGKKYALYEETKKEDNNQGSHQSQNSQNPFLKNLKHLDGSYSLFTGMIDEDELIIYKATFKERYDHAKITQILNEFLKEN